MGEANWKLTLEQRNDTWPRGALYPQDQLAVFKAKYPGQVDLSILSDRLSGKLSFTDGVFLKSDTPIKLDGEDFKPGQVVVVYPDGRIETLVI
jgi:hypothetical protein